MKNIIIFVLLSLSLNIHATESTTQVGIGVSLNYKISGNSFEGELKDGWWFPDKEYFRISFGEETRKLGGEATFSIDGLYSDCVGRYNIRVNTLNTRKKYPATIYLSFGSDQENCPFDAQIDVAKSIVDNKLKVEVNYFKSNRLDLRDQMSFKGSLSISDSE
ncbi:MAG: hypothetical protein CME69_06260 [Halobacteriovorax sp.]|nr:hypothetical protein [Halobacteriovorax sp.]|tara:strand:- start:1839 stop:2324 length:486 start_codon:yes stop_codon:yes gene_type:complete